jgi:HlyD family secretion protein
MKGKSLPIMLVALLIALFFAGGRPFSAAGAETAFAQDDGSSEEPEPVTFGPIVSAEGVVEPLNFVNLSFQIGGEVSEILANEGDQFQAGDALIQLDGRDLALALAQAKAQLASAEAALVVAQNQLTLAQVAITSAESGVAAAEANVALIKAGPRPEEIAAAEANIRAAESAVAQAAGSRDVALDVTSDADIYTAEAHVAQAFSELRLLEENYQTILDTCFDIPGRGEVCPLYGSVEENTREQLAAARATYEAALQGLEAANQGPTAAQQRAAGGGVSVAMANRDAAEAYLELLMAGATPEEIAIAELGVHQAEAGVELARAELAAAEAAAQQAEAAVVRAQANEATAQAAVDRTTLRAPFDGEVSRIDASVGQLVNPGLPVLMLADFDRWLVKTTDLTEVDVASVTEGAAVEVRLDAIPNDTVSGVVTKIALIAETSLGDVAYQTEILLDRAPDLPIRWGMTAFVEIESSGQR